MSILIKGMEMPKDGEIILVYPDGNAALFARIDVNILDFALKNRKAIPVPPHGRLIDADALLKDIAPTDEDEDNGAKLLMNVFCQVVKTRPTIIPASGGAEC